MKNLLRFANADQGALKDNAAHTFAARHALCHYESATIYTFIPKNACTTLRYSLALANGCIRGGEDIVWVNRNNRTFAAELRDLATARQSFVVLRCPYARLASFYLDRVVRGTRTGLQLMALIEGMTDLGQLTFRQLAQLMLTPEVRKANPHWREQDDFLVYETYTAYLRMEAFAEAVSEIKRLSGIDVQDARALSQHGLNGLAPVEDRSFCDVPAFEIAAMMASGRAPARRALFDDGVAADVASAYAADVALYRRLFGSDGLMYA